MRKQGWYWPWIILAGTLAVIWMSVYTVIFALDNPVQFSNDHINDYRTVDKNYNDMINEEIDFNKAYILSYLPMKIVNDEAVFSYMLTTKEGKSVDDATFKVLLTRPNVLKYDLPLELDSAVNGVYTFKKVKLPLLGRWDLFANISVNDKKGFLRLRLDTRFPDDALPFGTAYPMN